MKSHEDIIADSLHNIHYAIKESLHEKNVEIKALEALIVKLKKKLANSMDRVVAEDFAKEMYHKGAAYATALNAKNDKDKL